MSEPLVFTSNNRPTLGVEIELQLVDSETLALRSSILEVLAALPPEARENVKPELMQSYLEINTGICNTVADVRSDLESRLRIVQQACDRLGIKLLWAGTHPFSSWHEQQITPNDRYYGLVDLLQETARRLVTFGLHVHVGLDSGDKAVMICDRLMRYLPALLALSANSPFWCGRNTGLHSQRSKVMEGLPTAGLPPLMRNWSEYVWLLNHLIATGFIKTIREIWWDVRPHHNFGTVEVRICDMPPDLNTVLAITAITQCLVHTLSEEIDRGTYQFDCHPFMVRQNKWRACRYGLDALLVDPSTTRCISARQILQNLIDQLTDVAVDLRCADELALAAELSDRPSGAERQLLLYEQTGNLIEVVRRLLSDRCF